MRVHATPLLVVKASEESPHEPAPKMVPQSTLPRLRPSRRRSHRDPLSEGAPLPMQTLWADLHRDQRHRLLPDAQAEVVGGCSTDVAFLRLPTAGYCRSLRSRREVLSNVVDRSPITRRPS